MLFFNRKRERFIDGALPQELTNEKNKINDLSIANLTQAEVKAKEARAIAVDAIKTADNNPTKSNIMHAEIAKTLDTKYNEIATIKEKEQKIKNEDEDNQLVTDVSKELEKEAEYKSNQELADLSKQMKEFDSQFDSQMAEIDKALVYADEVEKRSNEMIAKIDSAAIFDEKSMEKNLAVFQKALPSEIIVVEFNTEGNDPMLPMQIMSKLKELSDDIVLIPTDEIKDTENFQQPNTVSLTIVAPGKSATEIAQLKEDINKSLKNIPGITSGSINIIDPPTTTDSVAGDISILLFFLILVLVTVICMTSIKGGGSYSKTHNNKNYYNSF